MDRPRFGQSVLAHPGSVGQSLLGPVHIVDDDGEEVATGVEGEVWFESPHRFEYHGDSETTESGPPVVDPVR